MRMSLHIQMHKYMSLEHEFSASRISCECQYMFSKNLYEPSEVHSLYISLYECKKLFSNENERPTVDNKY